MASLALLSSAGVTGCVGRIGAQGSSEPPPGPMPAHLCPSTPANPVFLRRLSGVEYVNSVRDLLGGLPDGFAQNIPSDAVAHGYDNNSETASFSDTRAEFYRDQARAAAAYAFDPSRRAATLGCDPSTGAACLRAFAQRFAPRAYRRPLASDEVDALVNLGTVAMDDPDPSMPEQLVTQAVLRASDFLYRVELGTGVSGPGGGVQLSGFEIATRLSYLVFNTTPSAALLADAEAGRLDTADGVEAKLQALLADPTAQPDLRRFFSGWLRLGDLDGMTRDAATYPRWNPALLDTMSEETLRTVEGVAWTSSGNMLDLIDGRFTYVNSDLASFYGLAAPGTGWQRVDLPDGSNRAGLLTHGSTLVANSADHEVLTIIRRGKWVRDVLMCDPLPPPPPNVPPLDPPIPGQSVRQQLAHHRDNPACSGCHDKMDPIGFGLSGFDEIGLPRTTDSRGQPVDTSGEFTELPGTSFAGPVQLAQELRTMPGVSRCMVQQVFRYTFGRSETPADSCALDQLAQSFQDGHYNFQQLLVAFVRSDAFRFRPRADSTMGGGM